MANDRGSNRDFNAATTDAFKDLKKKMVTLREQMGISEEKWQVSKS